MIMILLLFHYPRIEKYLTNLESGMKDCKPKFTPSEMKPCDDACSELLNDDECKIYKQIVGSLIYVMIATRPDISFIVSKLSQHMSNAKKCHMVMAKHALRYLNTFTASRIALNLVVF